MGRTDCPTIHLSDVIERAREEYKKPAIAEFAKKASIQESECYVNRGRDNPNTRYGVKPRIQETIEFAHKMGYKRLGVAFCDGTQKRGKNFNGNIEVPRV